jgi:hypothetical protein
MTLRGRDKRAQRKAAVAVKHGGFEPFFRPDGTSFIDDLLAAAPDDADFTLLDGTPVSPAAPWPTPQQSKEN